MRYLAITFLLAFLAPALAQENAPEQSLHLIDLRPPEEKEGSGLTPLAGKCNENVFRIADVATDPMKVDILKEDLKWALGPSGKTLTVLNWSIYYNKQVQKTGGGMLQGIGVGGYSIPTKEEEKKKAGSKCSQKESAGGWYQAKELESVYFPLISEFLGTFGGKPINVRIVYSPQHKLEGKFAGDAGDAEALLDAVHKTSEAVAVAAGP